MCSLLYQCIYPPSFTLFHATKNIDFTEPDDDLGNFLNILKEHLYAILNEAETKIISDDSLGKEIDENSLAFFNYLKNYNQKM